MCNTSWPRDIKLDQNPSVRHQLPVTDFQDQMQRPLQTISPSTSSLPQCLCRRESNGWIGRCLASNPQRQSISGRGPLRVRRFYVLPPFEGEVIPVWIIRGTRVQLDSLVGSHGDFYRSESAVLVDNGHRGVVGIFESFLYRPLHASCKIGLVGWTPAPDGGL